MKTTHLIALIGLPPFLACATAGSLPHEMSAEQHEATAKQEEQIAAGHQGQYDPKATATKEQCGPGGSEAFVRNGSGPCWTSMVNPTEAHRRAAAEHQKQAADHRAGSAALRQAEARACVGLSADDQNMSPFEHTEDIAYVTPLEDTNMNGRERSSRLVGATVTFRALPGMTTEWLQRVVDCHLARNAALGNIVPEMPNCPLVPKGIQARVSSTGSGFAVAIRSENPATAREILARAQRLMGSTGPVSAR